MMDEMQIGMDKTFEILDKVDILSLYDVRKQMRVCDLMDKVEGFVKSNSTLQNCGEKDARSSASLMNRRVLSLIFYNNSKKFIF